MKHISTLAAALVFFVGTSIHVYGQDDACKELPKFNEDFTLIDSTKAALGKEVGELASKITDYEQSRIPETEKLERRIAVINADMEKLNEGGLTEDESRQLETLAQDRKSAESFLDGKTSEKLKAELKTFKDDLSWRNAKLDCINAELAQMFSPQQSFKSQISLLFAGLIFVVIIGFFVIAYQDQTVRQAIFGGQTGLQFLTLFSIVIAIILFGITNILEGRELAALLGGLSGYILGKYNSPDRTGNSQAGSSAVRSLAVSPATATLSSQAPTQQLTATAVDANNNPIQNAAIQWTSDDPSVASVDQAGVVTRVAAGSCNVTAASGGVVSGPCAVTCQ
jgi:hypothetical protein